MKKSSFIALLMGTVSGVLFALGMCMALLPEWNAFMEGVIFGGIGLVLGVVTLLVWCKMENKKNAKNERQKCGAHPVRRGCGAGPGSRYVSVPCLAAVCMGHAGRLAGNRDADRFDSYDQRYPMKALGIVKSPYTGLVINFVYAVGNCAVGFLSHSWWFITVGAYYAVLAVTRFAVLQVKHNSELFVRRMTGILLVVLSVCIVGVNILSALKERGTAFHEILMIAIATYTFTKITIAIIGMVRAKHTASPVLKTLRNIALADACVSVYTMQRSMLQSFPGLTPAEMQMLNILTGTAVWIIVLFLGINLIGGKQVDMAKSKIVKANEKIAEAVTGGYKKIEKGVVEGYKKIEQGVVSGYTKMEDKFVDAYLTKEGETVEEAKARLKKEKQ